VGQIFYKYKSSPKSLCITNMATFSKFPLSNSTNGKQMLITASYNAQAQVVHTAVAGTSAWDEVWLYAYNDATSSLSCSILWGSGSEPADVIRSAVPSQVGRVLLVDGKLLQNGLKVSMYAQGPWINVDGFINRIT
jgi:hypothetical protein